MAFEDGSPCNIMGFVMFENLDDTGFPKSTEVIRISTGASRIISVTPQQIEYVGLAAEPCTIDLKECARNYVRWHSDHRDEFIALSDPAEVDAWNARCVGTRDLCDSPPWVQFARLATPPANSSEIGPDRHPAAEPQPQRASSSIREQPAPAPYAPAESAS